MSAASQFFGGGGDPIGTIKMGIGLDPTKWIPFEGQVLNRSDWPLLSSIFPQNSYSEVVRTLPKYSSSFAANSTHFAYIAGDITTSANSLYYSTNGIDWSSASVNLPTSGVSYYMLTAIGNRFIALKSGTDPVVSPAGTPGGTWQQINVGGSVDNPRFFIYSPELGRTLFVYGGTQVMRYLDDGSTTWGATSNPVTSSNAGCWTGSKFLIAGGGYSGMAVSSDGITWVRQTGLPFGDVAQHMSLYSNGAGCVVFPASRYSQPGVWRSEDHGVTWKFHETLYPITITAFNTGKFIGGTYFGTVVSSDGINWEIILDAGTVGMKYVKGDLVLSIANGSITTTYSTATPSANSFFIGRPNSPGSALTLKHYIKGA